jgi:hypothetical protein
MLILKKLEIEGMYFNMQKITYDKLIGNIILNGENRSFPLKSGARQGCLLFQFLFSIVLEFLASAKKQEKK